MQRLEANVENKTEKIAVLEAVIETKDQKIALLEADKENKGTEKRDKAAVRREEFLSIYKEENDTGNDNADDGPDLANGIRFKRDEEESDFTLKTSQDTGSGKPLI